MQVEHADVYACSTTIRAAVHTLTYEGCQLIDSLMCCVQRSLASSAYQHKSGSPLRLLPGSSMHRFHFTLDMSVRGDMPGWPVKSARRCMRIGVVFVFTPQSANRDGDGACSVIMWYQDHITGGKGASLGSMLRCLHDSSGACAPALHPKRPQAANSQGYSHCPSPQIGSRQMGKMTCSPQ